MMANLSARLSKLESAVPGRLRILVCHPGETREATFRRVGLDPADIRPTDRVVFVDTGIVRD
jgi:hypothetical protein